MKSFVSVLFCAALFILTACQTKKVAVNSNSYQTIVTYDITFDVNKSDIKPESMTEINRIKTLMIQNPQLRYEVQGHTDSTGTPESNQKLSEIYDEIDKLERSKIEVTEFRHVHEEFYPLVALALVLLLVEFLLRKTVFRTISE